MNTRKIALALAACAVAGAALAQTSVYKWVDKDGKVQYSSEPPPADAANVTQKRMGGGGPDDSQLPYGLQQAMKRNPLTLYVAKDCDLCNDARAYLTKRGIPYTERNIETNPADAAKVREVMGSITVPLLMVGDKPVKGYNDEIWQSTLDSAGYPRSGLPGQGGPRAPQ